MRCTNRRILFVLLLFVSVDLIFAQNPCSTPQRTPGTCMPLEQCPSLFSLVQGKGRTSGQEIHLRATICDFEDTQPKVCCENPVEPDAPVSTSTSAPIAFSTKSCSTENGIPAECVTINNCPQLFSILKDLPISKDNIKRLQQSQCGFEGTRPRVCCSQQTIESSPVPPDSTHITEQKKTEKPDGDIRILEQNTIEKPDSTRITEQKTIEETDSRRKTQHNTIEKPYNITIHTVSQTVNIMFG